MIPAGWIPPEFREPVYAPMTEEEIQNGISSMGYHENGRWRRPTREEFLKEVKKVVGVRDTRTGEIHWMTGQTPIMSVEVNRGQ